MISTFAFYLLFVQLLHSIEELTMGFHKKWYLFPMPFWVFLLFEIIHNIFWILVILTNLVPYKTELSAFFIALMFANGVQHIVWFGWEKKYVPGLLTAPLHIILFLVFFFQFLF
jgi:hypothetical protein